MKVKSWTRDPSVTQKSLVLSEEIISLDVSEAGVVVVERKGKPSLLMCDPFYGELTDEAEIEFQTERGRALMRERNTAKELSRDSGRALRDSKGKAGEANTAKVPEENS